MWKKLALLMIACGAATKAWRMWQERQHTTQTQRHKGEHAASVQRWEEEGGLPTVAKSAARPRRNADQGADSAIAAAPGARRRVSKPAAARTSSHEAG